MRKSPLFLAFAAFFLLRADIGLSQTEKIRLKWLEEQKTDYTQRWDPKMGWTFPPFTWVPYSMPMVGYVPNPVSYESIPGGIYFTNAEIDTETGNCKIEGFIARAHHHENGKPGSDCLPMENLSCEPFEKLPGRTIPVSEAIYPDSLNTITYAPVSISGIPCYTKNQAPVEIYLFERHFYWGDGIPYPSPFIVTVSVFGAPPPKIYHTTYDNPDVTKNKGYPVIVKKIALGKTDSLGRFSLEFRLNKKQHLMIGNTGYDLRQLFVQDYKEHPFLSGEKKFMDSVFRLTPTLLQQHPDYLFYSCHFRNYGNCDIQIININPAYGFMKARPLKECGNVNVGSCTEIIVYFPKNRLHDITGEGFTLFVSTNKGSFSFPAELLREK
ncbi:MAG: hypothetical protein ACOZCO_11200 [Bacteroidota bacterium]